MTSFFKNQTFGDDFYRRQGPAGAAILGVSSAAVRNAHPIAPGANDANGNYVIDTPAITNFVSRLIFSLASEIILTIPLLRTAMVTTTLLPLNFPLRSTGRLVSSGRTSRPCW